MIKFEGCEVEQETEKAILVNVPELTESPVWIPKSGIHADSECYKADTDGDLMLIDWFASQRGWL